MVRFSSCLESVFVDAAPARPIPSGAIDPSTGRLFLTVFPSIMLPMFMAVADQTIVASALPAIAAETGDVERISWIVVSYLLASTIAAPVYGYLGDLLGRRRLMFVALTIFVAASLLCAASPTIPLLSAARVLQGLGGGGLMSLSQALIGTGFSYDPHERAAQAQLLQTVLPNVRDVRRAGAAAVDLCSVAMGRLDAYYESGLKAWDSAAGLLICTETGLRHGELALHEFGPTLLVGPPGLFEALIELLESAKSA